MLLLTKMDARFPGIVVLGMAVAIALAVVMFTEKVDGPTRVCTAPSQCEGLGHPACNGAWTCRDNRCAWGCEVGECATPVDCEGLAHIQCEGEWACNAGKCAFSCEVSGDENPPNKNPGDVLFVDQHLHKDGRIIAGSYPFMFIDFPTYRFDEEARKLEGMINFNLTGLVALYGSGTSLGGDAGSGAGTSLYPVYSVPNEVNGDMITRIWEDGTVSIVHNNETITLKPGESWNEMKTWDETANNMGLIRFTTNDTITNYGYLGASDISEW